MEYLHTFLSALPIFGLAVGVIWLFLAIHFRARAARIAALVLLMVSSALVWPVCYYIGGHEVQLIWNHEANTWLNEEIRPKEEFAYLFFVVAALSVLTIIAEVRTLSAAVALAAATLLPGIAAVGLGAYMVFTNCSIIERDPPLQSAPATAVTVSAGKSE